MQAARDGGNFPNSTRYMQRNLFRSVQHREGSALDF